VTEEFHTASAKEIRAGEVADASLALAREILLAEGVNPSVVAEVRASRLPREWPWGVFVGLEEAVGLLEGCAVEVSAVEEGSVFFAEEPVLVVAGPYREFGLLETSLLGLVSQASGVATAAARFRLAAEGRPVYSFGAARLHPAIVPMVERASFIGGCAGVTAARSAGLVDREPLATMPHAAVLLLGEERAWLSLDRNLDRKQPRVVLVDTLQDEKAGAMAAARVLRDRLSAIRLDMPSSRRGGLAEILREIRWELDVRGFSKVQLFVSGDLGEPEIAGLNRYADSYGIDSAIATAPAIEFTLDIVEVDGRPRSRRGKLSGRKHLWGCPECGNRGIAPWAAKLGHCPRCDHRVRALLHTWLSGGKRRRRSPSVVDVRAHCMAETSVAPNPFMAHE
jgi:nicotinate phosphoribosyltransferase